MKVYVASSWRNGLQPGMVELLRADGHDVYDVTSTGDALDLLRYGGRVERSWNGWREVDRLIAP